MSKSRRHPGPPGPSALIFRKGNEERVGLRGDYSVNLDPTYSGNNASQQHVPNFKELPRTKNVVSR